MLESNYVCGLICFDTYHSISNIDYEHKLCHIGNHIIEILENYVGSYVFSDLADFLIRKYKKLNVNGKLNFQSNYNTLQAYRELLSYRIL